jgi:hypothetical protein
MSRKKDAEQNKDAEKPRTAKEANANEAKMNQRVSSNFSESGGEYKSN